MTDLLLFLPELSVLIMMVVFLCFIFVSQSLREKIFNIALVLSVATLFASLVALPARGWLFADCYQLDSLSQIFKVAIALALVFTIAISDHPVGLHPTLHPEYYFFLSSASLGLMMLTSAVELLTLYVSLELSSYSLYVLVPLRRQGTLSGEGGIKYLLFGAGMSGLLVYGLSLIFGLVQNTYFAEIAGVFPAISHEPIGILAIFLILAVFFFKLSAFPFHFWAPDAYEAGATQVTHFISTASKATAIALFLRLFQYFGAILNTLTPLFVVIAFTSMTLGNLVALTQQDMKRLLAYSSIAQAGYLWVALLAQTQEGYTAVLFYAIVYVLMNAAVFLVTEQVARAAKQDNPQIETFQGLAERSPLLALTLLLALLSLAGIPPLAGFTGKWILFTAAMNQGHVFLVLAGVINSVISLYYYLMVVKQAYWGKPSTAYPIAVPTHLRLLCYLFIIAIVALGVFPTFLLTQAQTAIASVMP